MRICNFCCIFAAENQQSTKSRRCKRGNNVFTTLKKILFLAMIAIAFMACEQNEATVVKKDQKMLTKASKELIGLMGADKAKAEKAILNAGFVKLEEDEDPDAMLAPAKYKKSPRKKPASKNYYNVDEYAIYLYNFPDDMQIDDETELINGIVVGEKKMVVQMQVGYNEGKMVSAEAMYYMPDDRSETFKLYKNFSNNMYSKIPSKATELEWYGYLYSNVIDSAYEDRASFVAELSQTECGEVEEECSFETSDGSVGYYATMFVPTEEDIAELAEEGLSPFVYGEFMIGWSAPMPPMASDRYKDGSVPEIDENAGTVNGKKYDNTTFKCWVVNSTVAYFGITSPVVDYVWNTEFGVVATFESTAAIVAAYGGMNYSYKPTTDKDNESCLSHNEESAN